jgi:hypothetical protein
MNIEYIETDKLVPYINNAKLHPEDQVGKIASSIKNFGFRQPLVVDKQNEVIAGHGRLQAAKKLGMEQVPCVRADDLSKAQVKALRLADNRTAESDWNWNLVQVELEELQGLDFDIALTGFDEGEIDGLLEGTGGQGEGQAGDPPDSSKLSDRFGVPPFTVLNAREGWWQERKRAWIALGIQSELGRGGAVVDGIGTSDYGKSELLQKQKEATLGAIAPNEQTIMGRTGKYKR